MSFLGRPSPPMVIWVILLSLSNAIALPLLKNGYSYWAFFTWFMGAVLIALTFWLWWYRGWSF